MAAVAQTTLSSLITPELGVGQLRERLASQARVYSAVTGWTGLSREQGLALVCAETTAPEGIVVVEAFRDQRHEGLVVKGRIQGEPTAQVLSATFDEEGRIVELKSYFKYMHPFTLIRENVRRRQPEIPADAWTVQPLPPDTGEFHESPQSFPWSPDLAFHSPVMRAPFTPRPVAAEILGHAHSVYGVREWSDLVLANGNRRMGWFDADIKGLIIEMAVLLTFEGERATEINAFARPWNASLALYSRVIARVGEELAPEYRWGDEQPAYESYL
jgi:hypothetical protein